MTSRATNTPTSKIWDLAGLRVTQIVIDPAQIRFLLSSDRVGDPDAIELFIQNVFTISDGKGTNRVVNPADAETLVPVLRLRLRSALSMVVGRDGSLTLRLAEGAELRVQKGDTYESWNTDGRGSLVDASMLCSPHEGPPWAE